MTALSMNASRTPRVRAATDPLLSIRDLRFRYLRQAQFPEPWLLRIDTLALWSDTVYSLAGDNMAGKSTLIRLLTGVIPGTTGDVEGTVDYGTGPQKLPVRRASAAESGLVAVHQNDELFADLSIWENVLLGARNTQMMVAGISDARSLLQANLAELDATGRLTVHAPLSSLSGGARAVIRLLRSVAWPYRILFLDEATVNLDDPNRDRVFRLLASRWRPLTSIVFVSHQISDHDRLRVMAAALGKEYQRIRLDSGGSVSCE